MNEPQRIVLRFPFVLKKIDGGNFRGNWHAKHSAVTKQRGAIKLVWSQVRHAIDRPFLLLPLVITCIRIAPSELDRDENLPMAFKAMKDELSDILGFNDRTPLVFWKYDQERGRMPVSRQPARGPSKKRPNGTPARVGVPGEYGVTFVIQEAACELCLRPLMGRTTLLRSETGFRCPIGGCLG